MNAVGMLNDSNGGNKYKKKTAEKELDIWEWHCKFGKRGQLRSCVNLQRSAILPEPYSDSETNLALF